MSTSTLLDKKALILPVVLVFVIVGLFGSVAYSPSSKDTLDSSSIVSSSSTNISSSFQFTSHTSYQTTYQTVSQTSLNGTVVLLPMDVGLNRTLNFQPATIRVVIGINNTVVWVNDDPIQHTVTSLSIPHGALRFDSGILNQGQTFTWTFKVPGTYKYYCSIHPDWMRGTVIVTG
jgi:plastocyanin